MGASDAAGDPDAWMFEDASATLDSGAAGAAAAPEFDDSLFPDAGGGLFDNAPASGGAAPTAPDDLLASAFDDGPGLFDTEVEDPLFA